jgi:toxin-antitoxin system PIN domain toxin
MPDVNVLVYAHRIDEVVHPAYRRWVEDLVNGKEVFGLSVLVAVAFVRIVTNRRIYSDPTPLPTALASVEDIVSHPNCRLVAPTLEHWHRCAELCRATSATGKVVVDAQHAALAIAEGCTWVTRDRDFAKFQAHGLRWQHLELGA